MGKTLNKRRVTGLNNRREIEHIITIHENKKKRSEILARI